MESFFRIVKKVLPRSLFKVLQPIYHYTLSFLGALLYSFPSNNLYVIGVTGTKGKSSTTEIINAILEEAGFKTAVINTIRFKTGKTSSSNLFKMTMPGRFFIQRFMYKAVEDGCTHLVLEMTSEGVRQFRHKFISLDALIFTNLSPEHIESHSSFEAYKACKLQLRDALDASKKNNKVMIVNFDDPYAEEFGDVQHAQKRSYSLQSVLIQTTTPHISFIHQKTTYTSPLQGEFNISNILAAITLATHLKIEKSVIQSALAKLAIIPGRVEYIKEGQDFSVVIDYAHTLDSLEKFYKIFEGKHCICVLGNTGGGRDTEKRPKMGALAERYCNTVILTNEDPYDEDPQKIVDDMALGMKHAPTIIMDRRAAIREALILGHAKENSSVLITGKGTDPFIMKAQGKKTKWSDANVAREEIKKILH